MQCFWLIPYLLFTCWPSIATSASTDIWFYASASKQTFLLTNCYKWKIKLFRNTFIVNLVIRRDVLWCILKWYNKDVTKSRLSSFTWWRKGQKEFQALKKSLPWAFSCPCVCYIYNFPSLFLLLTDGEREVCAKVTTLAQQKMGQKSSDLESQDTFWALTSGSDLCQNRFSFVPCEIK